MNKRDKLVKEFLETPMQIGEKINIDYKYYKIKSFNDKGEPMIQHYDYDNTLVVAKDYKRVTYKIGVNPFPSKPWNSSLRIVNFSMDSILLAVGVDKRKRKMNTENFGDLIIPELEWNPFVIDKDGEKQYYQRKLEWSLKDKQLLIESIYNNLDIGKLVIRKRSWKHVEANANKGIITPFKDIVDGKQRLNAIIGFVMDEFADLHGNYYSDLSDEAINSFGNFSSVSYGEIGEDASDEDVLSIFLNVNFTGRPMSEEHIEFVKSIKMK